MSERDYCHRCFRPITDAKSVLMNPDDIRTRWMFRHLSCPPGVYSTMPNRMPKLEQNSMPGWEEIGKLFARAAAELAGPNASAEDVRAASHRLRQECPDLASRYDAKAPASAMTVDGVTVLAPISFKEASDAIAAEAIRLLQTGLETDMRAAVRKAQSNPIWKRAYTGTEN